ncbi:MAG TPA: aromatic acid exporter family protein [Firmicutes bacterium]|jgi:uncharacterized membrane protein YgaE (UPF0421/DUF939 family)|nr:aromatic acid exporter family protein [Bacillota bacterium]
MTEGRGGTVLFGLRTLKTGVATALAVFLSGLVPHSLPMLAGVAAIICLQPSITAGVQKGLTRIQTTILGGLLGLVFHYLFGYHVLMLGIAVIIAIRICNWLSWEEGISLAALTVIVIMSQAPGEALPYTLGRVTSTLIGIVVATAINILVAPPRHLPTFRQELKFLTASFPDLYQQAVEAYAANDPESSQRILQELEAAEAEVDILQQELKYLQGAQMGFGVFLERIAFQDYILFDRCVHFLRDVMEKIKDLAEITQKRYHRKQELLRQGRSQDSDYLSPEFRELLDSLRELAVMLGELHHCVFRLVGEGELGLMPHIRHRAGEFARFQDRVRQSLKNWEVESIHKLDIFLLMSAHRIIFDLEEIGEDLTGLAKAAVAAAEKKEHTGQVRGEQDIEEGEVKHVLGKQGENKYGNDGEDGPGTGSPA